MFDSRATFENDESGWHQGNTKDLNILINIIYNRLIRLIYCSYSSYFLRATASRRREHIAFHRIPLNICMVYVYVYKYNIYSWNFWLCEIMGRS